MIHKNEVMLIKLNFDYLSPMMKILVVTDISVLRFYRYIGYIGDISADILEKNISGYFGKKYRLT